MMQVLLVIQVIVVVAMVAVILVQKSSSDGFTGNSSPNSLMTGRAQANLFSRLTSIFATIFIVNSLILAYLASHTERGGDVVDELLNENQTQQTAPDGTPDATDALDGADNLQNDNQQNGDLPQDNNTEEPQDSKPVVPAAQ